jgi:hypothetical protein
MTDKSKKARRFCVQALSKGLVTIDITASSLEEAVEKSKALEEKDFVEIVGECLEAEFRITGVYESDPS